MSTDIRQEDISDFTAEEMREFFEFLDLLRASGITNMYGAGPYIADAFGVDTRDSHRILSEWMRTFGERRKRGETVA